VTQLPERVPDAVVASALPAPPGPAPDRDRDTRLAAKVFEVSREGIVILDERRLIVSVNRAFNRLTGWMTDEVLGRTPDTVQSVRHDINFYRELWGTVADRGHWEGEVWLKRRDGSEFPSWGQISVVVDDDGRATHYVAICEDISERKAQEDRIRHLAQHDALTGLPNRALLEDRLAQAIPLARRNGTRLAVMFLDLDRFKLINDSLGHQAGDHLLREVARRLGTCVRKADTVSRQGGDEFVILLQELDAPEHAAKVARKVLEVVAQPVFVDGLQLQVTPSIGISVFPDDGTWQAELLRNADAAMYHAKGAGRNNFQFFTPQINARVIERVEIEGRLRRALDHGEFLLHYQPRFELATRRVVGMEALLRWRDPDRGMVPPGRFIPVAEECGLIVPLGEWVLQEACRQTAHWHRHGLDRLRVSVNVSAAQLHQKTFDACVQHALATSGLGATSLELEVTETSIMLDVEEASEILDVLKARGVHLSVDDFGTGYSSLAYLKRLPLDRVKIDRTFVKDVIDDADDAAITAAIIGMAHTLGMGTLAEGVETEAQAAFLERHGCQEVQGFLLARPLAPATFEAWVRAGGEAGAPAARTIETTG
jgi:diguanylate cyclase (GGDEF)-like protein/PAS domain S-box-containing protein